MKTTKKELEIDFIGGLGALTKEEEKALTDFFKNQKLLKEKKEKAANSKTKKKTKQPI